MTSSFVSLKFSKAIKSNSCRSSYVMHASISTRLSPMRITPIARSVVRGGEKEAVAKRYKGETGAERRETYALPDAITSNPEGRDGNNLWFNSPTGSSWRTF